MEYSDTQNERLAAKVFNQLVPVHLQTKGAIWEYLLDKNGQNAKAAASEGARLLSGETSGKGYKNARRNFEARNGKMSGMNTLSAKWQELGKKLPAIGKRPPKNGFTIHFKGRVKISGGRKSRSQRAGKERRAEYKGNLRGDGYAKADFTTKITGTDAYDFANNPTWDAVFAPYFENFESNPVTDFDVSSLVITGAD